MSNFFFFFFCQFPHLDCAFVVLQHTLARSIASSYARPSSAVLLLIRLEPLYSTTITFSFLPSLSLHTLFSELFFPLYPPSCFHCSFHSLSYCFVHAWPSAYRLLREFCIYAICCSPSTSFSFFVFFFFFSILIFGHIHFLALPNFFLLRLLPLLFWRLNLFISSSFVRLILLLLFHFPTF